MLNGGKIQPMSPLHKRSSKIWMQQLSMGRTLKGMDHCSRRSYLHQVAPIAKPIKYDQTTLTIDNTNHPHYKQISVLYAFLHEKSAKQRCSNNFLECKIHSPPFISPFTSSMDHNSTHNFSTVMRQYNKLTLLCSVYSSYDL